MASIGAISYLGAGQERRSVLTGVGVVKEDIQVTLGSCERFVGYEAVQKPLNTYTVLLPHNHAPGKTAFHNHNRVSASTVANAVLNLSAGPASGGLEASGSVETDKDKRAHLDVESTGQFVMISVRGGKEECLCFGSNSSIELYAIIQRVAAASSPTLGGLQDTQEKEQIQRHKYIQEQQEKYLQIRDAIESDRQRLEQERKTLILQQQQKFQGIEDEKRKGCVQDWQEGYLDIKKTQEFALAKLRTEAALAPIAFGVADWNKYFGDVGTAPPLPANINEILEGPCPIWPGKKVKETHVLTLIPQTVNGKAFTLDGLKELLENPKGGAERTTYRYSEDTKQQFGGIGVNRPYWVLMTKDVLPNTRSKKYDEQLEELRRYGGYEVPKLIEAAAGVLMEWVKTGQRLLTDSPAATYTRCQEKVSGEYPGVVGELSSSGLSVALCLGSDENELFGLAAARKF